VSQLLQDLRYALRTLAQSPGFTAVAILTLALGIGANTAIFSVIDTVLLKPMGYPDPDRIIAFLLTSPGGSGMGASVTKFNVWREQTEAFQDVSAWRFGVANLTGTDNPEQIQSTQVSANFFRLFGAPVIQGRTFTADEDRPNGPHVAVLSYGLWQRRFGGDPQAVGKTVSISGTPYNIVGVLGADFRIEIEQPPDIYLPFQIDPNSTDQAHYFTAGARLKPGVTIERAKAQLQLAAEQFRRKFLGTVVLGPKDGFSAQRLQDAVVGGETRTSLLTLAGAVSFVLLIACANVANLLLARATGRKREIAIRAALGAGRSRIVRQLLTESVVLSLAGGVVGLALGMAGIKSLLAASTGINIPRVVNQSASVTMDWRVVTFTLLISLVTGVLFGLIPAMQASRVDLSSSLKESSGRSGTGLRQNKARALLVVTEMTLALVLLVGAALLIRTYVALKNVNPGFDAHNVLTMRMSLSGARFEKTAAMTQMVRDGLERIKGLPGVASASGTCCVPLEGGYGLPFIIVGRPLDGPSHGGGRWTPVSPGYFDVFKIPILRGRDFTDRDERGAGGVTIINQTMAKKFWPNGDALGAQIIIGKGVGPEFEEPPRQIIGIAGDTRDNGLNRDPGPTMYVPSAQTSDGVNALNVRLSPIAWVVRTRVEPHSLSLAIQSELRQASGGLPAARVRSMEEVVAQSTARQNFNMLLLSIFAGSALLLAGIGIYGLMAYSVQQRTQEIGIRLALGAESAKVRNMVVYQGMRLALVGVAVGLAGAFGLTRLLASFLFGVQARDPMVFTSVPVVLTAVALAAVWLPARRATRVDPVIALRYE